MIKNSSLSNWYDKFDRISIIKINSNYKVLYGSEYKFETYEGKEIPGRVHVNDSGAITYYFDSDFFNSYENTVSLLPDMFKEELDSYQNYQDFRNSWIFEKFGYVSGSYVSNSYYIYVPIRIVETKSPIGYKAMDMTTFLRFDIEYSNRNEEELNIEVSHSTQMPVFYNTIEFDVTNYNNYKYDLLESYQSSSDLLDRRCGEQIIAGPSTFDENYCSDFAYFFENEEGVIKLEISNTVNNLTKFNASSNKNLEYKIYVKNTGDAPSGNNVITTNVPDKVIVDESSISDAGIYNKKKNIITWNIERIDNKEQVVVSYKALAPDTASGEELIGNSMVLSAQQTIETYSNNTIVSLDKIVEIINNPNTGTSMIYIPNTNIGMPISILFIILIVMSITSMVIMNRIKKKKIF